MGRPKPRQSFPSISSFNFIESHGAESGGHAVEFEIPLSWQAITLAIQLCKALKRIKHLSHDNYGVCHCGTFLCGNWLYWAAEYPYFCLIVLPAFLNNTLLFDPASDSSKNTQGNILTSYHSLAVMVQGDGKMASHLFSAPEFIKKRKNNTLRNDPHGTWHVTNRGPAVSWESTLVIFIHACFSTERSVVSVDWISWGFDPRRLSFLSWRRSWLSHHIGYSVHIHWTRAYDVESSEFLSISISSHVPGQLSKNHWWK